MRRLLTASVLLVLLTACSEGAGTSTGTAEADAPKVPLRSACLALFIPEGPVPAFQKVWMEDLAERLTRETRTGAADALEETADLLPTLPSELAVPLETMASETERVLFPTDTAPVPGETFNDATEELLDVCDGYI